MFQFRGFLSLLLVISLTEEIYSNKLPKTWKVCRKGTENMNECLKDAMEHALHDLVNGNPSLGVLPIDPFHIDSLTINQGTGPVSILLQFTNLTLFGFKDFRIHSLRNDWKTMEVNYSIPTQLIQESSYNVDGKILLLPIKGSGHNKMVFDNFRTISKFEFKEIEQNGLKYHEITKYDFEFDADKVSFQIDNLFNGDKKLGDNMNLFLNQNWREILLDLTPAISSAFGEAFRRVGNRILTKIPIEELTPD